MIADLIDDILAPLGTVVTPAGMHPGRSAGSLVVHGSDGSTRLDLMPGGLALVDLPPGTSAVAEFKFRESVRLGARGTPFRDRRDRRPRRPRRRPARRPAQAAGSLGPPRRAARVVADRDRDREGGVSAADVRLISARRLIAAPVDAVFALAPGDRPLVSAGDSVVLGAPIAERLRDPRLDELEIPAAAGAEPGGRWVGLPRRGDEQGPGGEYMFDWHGRWRVATGDMADAVESPFAGIVRSVRPGTGITIRAAGRGIRGVVALGGPTRGRLQAGAEGRAALGRSRRRLGGHDPGRRLAGRCGDADPRPGDGRLRRGRRRPVEQGAARLHRLRGAPAGGPPSAAAVRRAGPRRGHATAAGRRGPGRPRRPWPVARSRSSPTRRRSSSTCRTW